MRVTSIINSDGCCCDPHVCDLRMQYQHIFMSKLCFAMALLLDTLVHFHALGVSPTVTQAASA